MRNKNREDSASLSPASPTSNPLRVYLLGPPYVSYQGETVSISRRHVRAILYYLTAQRYPVSRDRLCLLFWPDQPESSARRNLTRLLTHLRRELPCPEVLVSDQDQVCLDLHRVWSDADEFTWLVDRKQMDPGYLEKGIALVRGPFLDGFYLPDCPEFDRWSSQEQSSFEALYLQALASLVEAHTTGQNYASAIQYAQRYLEVDELAEEMHSNLIRLYALNGDRSRALRQYEECVAILERELGTNPLPETRAIYLAILQGILPGVQAEPKQSYQPAWISQLRLDVPLIGRAPVLLRLEEGFKKSKAVQSQVVLISGEPGIGKTRLLHDFVSQHQNQCLLLFGSGDRGEELLPYHPIVEALHSVAHLVPPSLSPTWLAELSRLIPEVNQQIPGLPAPLSLNGEEARIRLFEALSQFIKTLQADFGPILLCLDNLHWFDQTSLSWLIHFCRQVLIRSKQIMLIGTYRSEDALKIKELRDSLARVNLLDELKLEGLDRANIHELLRILFDHNHSAEAFASRLQEATGGNPFFILETLRTLEEEHKLSENLDQLTEFPLPEGVREAINRRLGRLHPTARQILEAGAILGPKFGFQVVHLTGGRNELETVAGCEELKDRQLLMEEAESYHFSHDLVRKATLAAISPIRSRLLHQRAGRALEQLEPKGCLALAHHFDLGGEWRKALHYYQLSVQKAETVYARQEALSLYARMLELLELLDPEQASLDDLNQRGEILKSISWQQYLQGDLPARDETLKKLDILVEDSQSLPLRLQSLFLHTRFYQVEGHYAQALSSAERGLVLAGEFGHVEMRGRLLTQLGIIYYLLGQPSLALEKLEIARQLIDPDQELELYGQIMGRIGFIKSLFGHYQEALICLQETRDCYLRRGNLYAAKTCLIEIGRWQTCLGRFNEARLSLLEALEIARQANVQVDEGHALLATGGLLLAQGEYGDALQTYEVALTILYPLQNQHLTVAAEIAMGTIYCHLGAYELSQTWLERGLQSARAIQLKPRVCIVLIRLAMLADLRREPTRALEYLGEGLKTARENNFVEIILAGLSFRAGIERRRGDLPQAMTDIDEALRLSKQVDLPAFKMWARAEASLIQMEIGYLPEALNLIQEAVELIPMSEQTWIEPEEVHSAYRCVLERMGEMELAREQAQLADIFKQSKAERISDPDLRQAFLAIGISPLL